MTPQATGKFKVQSWDENPYAELDGGGKLTRASVTQAFEGDIDGEGSVGPLLPQPAATMTDSRRRSTRIFRLSSHLPNPESRAPTASPATQRDLVRFRGVQRY